MKKMMLHPDREELPRTSIHVIPTTDDYDSVVVGATTAMTTTTTIAVFVQELWSSTEQIFSHKITWLLVLGPIALVGDAAGILGEPICFAFSGVALIPCAERLSFVTEQVAAHTNGTIGALLNATFGNAPELLISTAALRSGFYRVTQLTMLGSMLCNLLFVFGLSCLVGGIRWQVQALRITSGNVSVGMLLASTAGSLLPAVLIMSRQIVQQDGQDNNNSNNGEQQRDEDAYLPSSAELAFSRVNAAIMMFLYLAYLTFQIGTHKDEFDQEENVVETEQHLMVLTPHYVMRHHGRDRHSQRNVFCLKYCFFRPFWGGRGRHYDHDVNAPSSSSILYHSPRAAAAAVANNSFETDVDNVEMVNGNAFHSSQHTTSAADQSSLSDDSQDVENVPILLPSSSSVNDSASCLSQRSRDRKRRSPLIRTTKQMSISSDDDEFDAIKTAAATTIVNRSPLRSAAPAPMDFVERRQRSDKSHKSDFTTLDHQDVGVVRGDKPMDKTVMSLRAGVVWLFIITLCISAMSDILVDTIDGFAYRFEISEVFTSMVIVPFFSNVAEQVSAVLFAYRNKMDLCVGVTVGSAIQVALFVLPGCVLIGMMVDRSMSLYFRGYETCCLALAVIIVAAVLQGGTTNWLVGFTLIAIYIMMACGFWFHELEDLSSDAEIAIQNSTGRSLHVVQSGAISVQA